MINRWLIDEATATLAIKYCTSQAKLSYSPGEGIRFACTVIVMDIYVKYGTEWNRGMELWNGFLEWNVEKRLIEFITSIGYRVTNFGRGWYDVTNQCRGVAETAWDVRSYHPRPRFVTLDPILVVDYFSCTWNTIMIFFQIYHIQCHWKQRWRRKKCGMCCDVINNNVNKKCQQSTVPNSPFRIEFSSTGVLVGFSRPRYEKLSYTIVFIIIKIPTLDCKHRCKH